ncbi:MAG TPA: anthranilate phosphoribosyltransferase, partial [Chthonomonadales bacterium]|nr:anthranilate phosphoribosyltransferase [Chthonomonadales bacterium]
MGLQQALAALADGVSLTREEARQAVGEVMDGCASQAQIGALLIALKQKGESLDEIVGFAAGMRERVSPVRASRRPLLDICGTGGAPCRVFNVSTAAAFIGAAGGVAVAKHGNRAMSGVCGSADVLEALGVALSLCAEHCARCIDEVGIGFLFAPMRHPAMRHAASARKELGIRTIFNLVGPLTNPAGASLQVMGVSQPGLVDTAAMALRELGSERAIVAHGAPGMAEISTLGETRIAEWTGDEQLKYRLSPRQLGLPGPGPSESELAPASTPEQNAKLVREALSGKDRGAAGAARRNLVAVNGAAALRLGLAIEGWPEAVDRAQSLISDGSALAALDRLIAFS